MSESERGKPTLSANKRRRARQLCVPPDQQRRPTTYGATTAHLNESFVSSGSFRRAGALSMRTSDSILGTGVGGREKEKGRGVRGTRNE